ncbi:MAG: hypothetical protein WD850_03160 [Candidatus Spechtbacterales bacterium]
MTSYRFSPIKTHEELFAAVQYVAKEAATLAEKVTGQRYPITYLTIFAHSQEEYDGLVAMLASLGEVSEANNGQQVKLNEAIDGIPRIRVRKPDPQRPQVGCVDFDAGEYEDFKNKYLNSSEHLRLIERPDYEMVEFFGPQFDILGYVVSAPV